MKLPGKNIKILVWDTSDVIVPYNPGQLLALFRVGLFVTAY